MQAMETMYGIDLKACVDRVFHDGGVTKVALQNHLPMVQFRRCLQHVRENVLKKIGSSLGAKINEWIMHSAFLPSPFLFSKCWHLWCAPQYRHCSESRPEGFPKRFPKGFSEGF